MKISSLRMDRKEGIEFGAKYVVKWGAQVHFSGVLPLLPVQETGRHWFLTRLCPYMVGVSSGIFLRRVLKTQTILTSRQ